jgi:hypothetical protein
LPLKEQIVEVGDAPLRTAATDIVNADGGGAADLGEGVVVEQGRLAGGCARLVAVR